MLAAFLAGYRGLTRDAYALDLRQFVAWCTEHDRRLFDVLRADIECFARDLEARGRARATVARRLFTVAGFYRNAGRKACWKRSPAAHVRRPRLDYESHATGLDPNEVGVLLVAAGLASPSEHALVTLLAINGLRISEALGAVEALGLERGPRTLTVERKGGKVVVIPLAPRTARAIDLAIGERAEARSSEPGWRAPRPPRGLADRAPACPQGRDQQAGWAAHASTRVHHGCPSTQGSLSETCKGRRRTRRPANDDALRPGEGVARPARDLHRGRLVAGAAGSQQRT